MNRRRLLHLALLPLLAPAARAGPGRVFAPEELARLADAVLVGRVTGVRVARDAAGRIRTVTRLLVTEAWLGRPAGHEVEVVQAGGVLGQEAAEAPEQPVLAPGDELVAFLRRTPAGEWTWAARAQGCFHVTADGAGRRLVHNPHFGSAAGGAAAGRPPNRRPLALAALRARVEEARP
jgi:hypothetical protein